MGKGFRALGICIFCGPVVDLAIQGSAGRSRIVETYQV